MTHDTDSKEYGLRGALKTAIEHIEHMAAWISHNNSSYSFESLGEDMPGIREALRRVSSVGGEVAAMEAVMENVDPATWPGLTTDQRCSLGRFAKPHRPTPPSSGEGELESLQDWLISLAYKRIETLDPQAKHRSYYECQQCGGTDMDRDHYKPERAKVRHDPKCLMLKYDAALRSRPTQPQAGKPKQIITEHLNPPIPTRGNDWVAYRDGGDGAPDGRHWLRGYGATEQDAIDDLLMQELT